MQHDQSEGKLVGGVVTMINKFLVRLTALTALLLGFNVSAIYFLLVVLLLNTHHRDIFGW
ncbi:hypothetical protein C9I94_20135 [Photobacterium swingsii]|uniref:Uncharacterized protein n=2 Tax=Photobacterium TaxID=657 RepID=A0A2T3P1X0_9GAMM|nr:hypothetical protein C9I94_20135 [Photobacterium swingsii]CAK1958752.1 hypothetical protein VCRA2110O175_270062 [Vibrio crassostreae]